MSDTLIELSNSLIDGHWCDLMACHVTDTYFSGRVAAYKLAHMNAPNMSGTIRRTLSIQPETEKIYVFAPGKNPIIYAKSLTEWHSIQGP